LDVTIALILVLEIKTFGFVSTIPDVFLAGAPDLSPKKQQQLKLHSKKGYSFKIVQKTTLQKSYIHRKN
jgi:hypothetical protein